MRRRPERAPRPRAPRSLLVEGEPVVVAVRESPRARRLRLVVHPQRPPEVVVPAGAPDAIVDGALAEHREWLVRAVLRARRTAALADALGLAHAGIVWLDGRPLPVVRGARAGARLRDGRLHVTPPAHGDAVEAVIRWYRRQARTRLEEAVSREGARLGLRPGPVSVRGQRTRWGSCARNGALSFNWRLVLAPVEVRDYVVVHELCHLRRHDHSPAYWRLVAEAMPDWEPRARWLREHGPALLAYDPAVAVDGVHALPRTDAVPGGGGPG